MKLTPEAAAKQADLRKKTSAVQSTLSDHSRKCLPIGMPGMMTNEFALEFLQTPGRMTILSENSPLPRSVYLTEKAHTDGLEPSWNGHSIGHFEGKALVIDTVNFNDRVGPINGRGVHSPTTHLVERYYLEGPDRLVGEMTFEDPNYLAAPSRPCTTTTGSRARLSCGNTLRDRRPRLVRALRGRPRGQAFTEIAAAFSAAIPRSACAGTSTGCRPGPDR